MSNEIQTKPLQLDGEILSGRLVVYADTLALGLVEMADKFDAVDPLILVHAGHTPGRVLREIGGQLAQGVMQYAPPDSPSEPGLVLEEPKP